MQKTKLIYFTYYHAKSTLTVNFAISPPMLENIRKSKLLATMINSNPYHMESVAISSVLFQKLEGTS